MTTAMLLMNDWPRRTLQLAPAPAHKLVPRLNRKRAAADQNTPIKDSTSTALPQKRPRVISTLSSTAELSTKRRRLDSTTAPTPPTIRPKRLRQLLQLNEGTYATVYVVDTGEPQHLALKKISKKSAFGDYGCLVNALNEVRVATRFEEALLYGAIVNWTEGAWSTRDDLCILQQLHKGDLYDVWTADEDSGLSAQQVMVDIGAAIATLHALGIVHRDVKLENIFVTWHNKCVLGDFGTAYIGHPGRSKEYVLHSMQGTLGYIAPEMYDGKYGCAVDWWALGMVFHQLITEIGEFPFPYKHGAEGALDLSAYLSLTGLEKFQYFVNSAYYGRKTGRVLGRLLALESATSTRANYQELLGMPYIRDFLTLDPSTKAYAEMDLTRAQTYAEGYKVMEHEEPLEDLLDKVTVRYYRDYAKRKPEVWSRWVQTQLSDEFNWANPRGSLGKVL